MLILITGGSGSGKSAYAEKKAVSLSGKRLLYLATMDPYGEEGARRIARHRKLRKGKGFETVERSSHLGLLAPDFWRGATVLLEDLSNLLANEMFSGEPVGEADLGLADRIFEDILAVVENCDHLVVVTNDIFSDGEELTQETALFCSGLGYLNRLLAERADEVTEVVYGIPVTVQSRVPSQLRISVYDKEPDNEKTDS